MQDILTMIEGLRRPRLLVRAGRIGAEDYRREKHLQRILGFGRIPKSGAALVKLMEIEATLNEQRRAQDACYSLLVHIDVLIAVMGESHLLRATLLDTASGSGPT